MINDGMLSSKSIEWATPKNFFIELDKEFHFTLDPCATDENKKCEKYFTIKDDGLSKPWSGNVVFMNPPYGKEIALWVQKGFSEWENSDNTTVVMLLPSRTDTRWFHNYIYKKADEIRFLKGRLKFNDIKKECPFPSMVVVFREKKGK